MADPLVTLISSCYVSRVWTWLCRLFGKKTAPTSVDQTPAWAIELCEQLGGSAPPPWAAALADQLKQPTPPPWATELADLVQRSARSQSKTALRLEEIERKLEGGFLDLHKATQALARPPTDLRWDEVLDALDLLEEARSSVAATSPAVAQGLAGVQARLLRHLSASGLVRHANLHEPADGTLFRVVGTEVRDDLPDGVVTRVIRAAVRRGDQLIREGEVLTNRKPS